MKRLKSKLLAMEPSTQTYKEMYEGHMTAVDPTRPWFPPMAEYDPTYYYGEIGFYFSATHKLAQDKPTVTVIIPPELLFTKNEGDIYLKRLKYYLLGMEASTSTYKEMYEGEIMLPPGSVGNNDVFPVFHNDPTYWHGEASVHVDTTHKLAQDVPTLTWHIPTDKLGIYAYTAMAADFCLRAFKPYIDALNAELYNRSRPASENGKYYLHEPGGEVLLRNAAYFALHRQKDYENGSGSTVYLLPDSQVKPQKMCLCLKMQVQLPRKKLRKAVQMLCRDLPDAIDRFVAEFDRKALSRAFALADKQAAIRRWLKESDYCAFVANGSILPRAKGTDLPLQEAVPFISTPEDELEVAGVRGMGIKKGVTVITGGGYSGKSTLLDAISAGIYDHAPGDGRELCITDDSAVTISAEDGRSVKRVNISPFIQWLPGGDTSDFSTHHASGSTSQAANIMEAVAVGSRLLLIDEDRSATNFMIRDRMMKELIEKEPIIPFTDRVKELYAAKGTSTLLVIGGSGEYLSVADRIYKMEDYRIFDVTARARQICRAEDIRRDSAPIADWSQSRTLRTEGFTSYPEGSGSERLEVSDMGFILIGDEHIDVRGLHDIVSPRQLDALGFLLRQLEIESIGDTVDLQKRIEDLYTRIGREGLDFVYSSYFTTCRRFLDLPRPYELMAVIARMRRIHFKKSGSVP
ncbi:MAG: ABC-ATPase domain-containing protein [Clostridia bacterium]|nr:ABC-ATPase domain-containing protein [Clostridia bacterium]